MQGDDEQEAEGDGGAGAELRQLQPPASQGAASGAQQLCRGLSGELLKTLLDSYLQYFVRRETLTTLTSRRFFSKIPFFNCLFASHWDLYGLF